MRTGAAIPLRPRREPPDGIRQNPQWSPNTKVLIDTLVQFRGRRISELMTADAGDFYEAGGTSNE